MELKDLKRTTAFSPPLREVWTGRETDPALGIQYWHQAIELHNAEELFENPDNKTTPDLSIVGYVCDEGVKRNKGRVGAAHGPQKIRERLSKIAYHVPAKTVGDFGDVNCIGNDLELCQQNLATVVSSLVKHGSLPMVIGGGHDIAYGHFVGLIDAKKDLDDHKFGLINFDAHFDLRPVVDKPNSGSPFNQILSEFGDQVKYFAIGIQPSGNTKALFDIASKYDVQFVESTDCHMSKIAAVCAQLDEMISTVDSIYLSIDMDGFSSAYAPGVSAPSPFGFEPNFVLEVLKYILSSGKVISCDIAELNPKFDQDNLTANLAARLIDFIATKV